MRNSVNKIALAPRADNVTPVSPCVFYKLHEGTGTALADSLGNGPTITLAGTGAPWANKAWVTPNGTDDYATVSSANIGILTDIFRMDQPFGQILVGFDFYYDGDVTTNEFVFYAGVDQAADGGWGIYINSVEQMALQYRGIGGTAKTDVAIGDFTFDTVPNQRVSVVMDIKYLDATHIDLNMYVNGVFRKLKNNIDWLLNGATAPYGGPVSVSAQAFSFMVKPTSTVLRINYLNSAASNARMARFLAIKLDDYSAARAEALSKEMYDYMGEIPRMLDGL